MVLVDRQLHGTMEQLSLGTTISTSTLRFLDTMEFFPCFTDEVSLKYQSITKALGEIGPYDVNCGDSSIRRKFSSVEIFAYYPRGDVEVYSKLEQLINYLKNGYNERRAFSDVSFRGFGKEFWLDNAVFPSEKTNIFGYEMGHLGDLLTKQVSQFEQARMRMAIPLAIVAGTSHRSVTVGREQYYEAKREFSSKDIPCQYASYYSPDTNVGAGILYNIGTKQAFGYGLWNFALDMYGKLGGLAWVVPQKLSRDPERVIDLSIGLSFVRTPSIDGQRFYVGYATIIDKFGRWVGVVTSESFQFESSTTEGMVVPRDKIEMVVSKAIDLARSNEKTRGILDTKNNISISMFRLDRFHASEIEGVEQALKTKFGTRQVKLGLVSIVSDPTLNLVEEVPRRGLAVQINDKAFIAYSSIKRGALPTHPVVAKVENLDRPNCAFGNLTEAANHILATCTLHWQTAILGSARLPAPLNFAHNIASLSAIGAAPKPNSWLWGTLWFI